MLPLQLKNSWILKCYKKDSLSRNNRPAMKYSDVWRNRVKSQLFKLMELKMNMSYVCKGTAPLYEANVLSKEGILRRSPCGFHIKRSKFCIHVTSFFSPIRFTINCI